MTWPWGYSRHTIQKGLAKIYHATSADEEYGGLEANKM